MSHKKIIAENSTIFHYLLKLNFKLYFTIPVLNHIAEFLCASVQKGYDGSVKDIVTLSLANCHRTTFGKFLSQGVWNMEYAWRAIRREVIRVIYHYSQNQAAPIFAIFDDTIAEKTKPSSQAKSPIQATSYHQSHLKRKQVWGHQLLAGFFHAMIKYCLIVLSVTEKATKPR